MKRFLVLTSALLVLTACEGSGRQNLAVDEGIDDKSLSELKAGIWVDPNGCEHWIIDDGIEGYLSQRLQRNGLPVCGNAAPGGTIINDFKRGSDVRDIF